ncbi:RhoGEF Gef3 [Schizosaccharomyces japonicus yFS275]|uniref:RhoGEF Gef3 n=1 Tax=Schizosaccharomyces japonicus (strain yFS275 / FY16936) TaxID=402676 RepID=B6K0T1_SCHJY|nr:RhoGEF Gef3 [Schizosaccharomyces japonicus yFS275]EEB07552.1 RhoGEF Gef3 [Schizosaccharomyces japonicus yFS275]
MFHHRGTRILDQREDSVQAIPIVQRKALSSCGSKEIDPLLFLKVQVSSNGVYEAWLKLQKSKTSNAICILLEMKESEQAYIHDLYVAKRFYAERLYPVLDKQEWRGVFGQFLPLCSVAARFAKDLCRAIDDEIALVRQNAASSGLIAQQFLRWLPQLKDTYSRYCLVQDRCSEQVKKWLRDENLTSVINQCDSIAKIESSSWNLDSFLVKPMQRFLKYPLLLNQLYRASLTTASTNFALLAEACSETEQAAQCVNEMKLRQETVERALRHNSSRSIFKPRTAGRLQLLKKMKGIQTSVSALYIPNHEQIVALIQELAYTHNCLLDFRNSVADYVNAARTHFNKLSDIIQCYGQVCKGPRNSLSWTNATNALENITRGAILRLYDDCHRMLDTFITPLLNIYERPLEVCGAWLQSGILFAKRRHARQDVGLELKDFPLLGNCLMDELPIFMQKAKQILSICVNTCAACQQRFLQTAHEQLKVVWSEHKSFLRSMEPNEVDGRYLDGTNVGDNTADDVSDVNDYQLPE